MPSHWHGTFAFDCAVLADLLEAKIYVIGFQYMLEVIKSEGDVEYMPVEVGIVEWSMGNGISREFHRLINPGKLYCGISTCERLVNLCQSVSSVASRQHLRSANRGLLFVPRYRLNSYSRWAFSVAGCVIWNWLPDSMRDPAISRDSFRRSLKTFLFSAYLCT